MSDFQIIVKDQGNGNFKIMQVAENPVVGSGIIDTLQTVNPSGTFLQIRASGVGPAGSPGPSGADGVDGLQGIQGITGSTGSQGPAGAGGGPFGSGLTQDGSENESITSSNSFQTKLNVTTDHLSPGLYRVGWYCEYRNSDGDKPVRIRVRSHQVSDPDTTIAEVYCRPKEANVDFEPFSGFAYVDWVTPESVKLQFRANPSEGGTAKVRKARIEIWRIE